MIPEQQTATATASDGNLIMTGSTAADPASAAVPAEDGAIPSPPKEAPNVCKPLKGLLKSCLPSGEKSRKRVKFSETLLVFCEDWPMEQIIALKSPSDFNLVEVAAQGYMFEPPVEYQDCMSFDPPPDYRDLSHVQANGAEGSEVQPDAFAFVDSAEDTSVYWQSVILNDKENLEEDAIIGVLKEDAILQAIGARHSSVFHPPVADGDLSQEDFPIHYSDPQVNRDHIPSSLSPSSSTSSLLDPHQRQASAVPQANDEKVHFDRSSPQNEAKHGDEDPASASSPTESVQDLPSDSSFTSQDTIIVMTKEILRGNLSPFDLNFDDENGADNFDSLPDDLNRSTEDNARSCTPGSDDSSSIGRFRIISCPEEENPAPKEETQVQSLSEDDNLSKASSEFSSDIRTDETRIQSQTSPNETGADAVPCESPIDSNIGRFHVSNYSQEQVNSVSNPSDSMTMSVVSVTSQSKKRAPPPPPPAKPPIAVLRQRMSVLQQQSVSSDANEVDPVVDKGNEDLRSAASEVAKASQLPTRSGSVPNAIVSVSEIRKAFEKRGLSLDSTSSLSAVESPAVTKDQRPKSFPASSDSSSLKTRITANDLSSLTAGEQRLRHPSAESAESKKSSKPLQSHPPFQSGQESTSGPDPREVTAGRLEVSEQKPSDLVEYAHEPRALVPSKRTSSLANFHPPAVVCNQPSPSVARVLYPQPVYLSLNRRDPHQLLTLHQPTNSTASLVTALQPPARSSSVQVPAAAPQTPPRSVQYHEKQASCGQIIRTQQVLVPQQQQQFAPTRAGLVSPNAIYGYIRNCSDQCAPGTHVHYHHPQILLQHASQKLSSNEDFPNASEIRRRDGINAFPNVWQEPPTPGKFPVASIPAAEHADELEQFVQQEQDRTERIKQRYAQHEDESSDDPTFGFGKRPAVRGIRTDHPDPSIPSRMTCITASYGGGQVFVHPVGLNYPQRWVVSNPNQRATVLQGGSARMPQQPLPPSRHVYLVRAPHYSPLLPAGSTLPRNIASFQNANQLVSRACVPGSQPPSSGSERPASSMGQSGQDVFVGGCPQCLMQKQLKQVDRQPDPMHPEVVQEVAYPVHAPNNSLLTYKTISMPNVAMIRPVGLLSMVQRGNEPQGAFPGAQYSSNDSSSSSSTPQPRTSMSASAALSTMTGMKGQVHNNNPDLVIDATSRTSCPQAVASSSPLPSSSSNASSSSSHQTATASFLKPAGKKESKSKEDKKKSKKEKKKQTKEGLIYYSMNV